MARESVGDHFGIAVNPVDGLAGDESVSELDPELQKRQDRNLRKDQPNGVIGGETLASALRSSSPNGAEVGRSRLPFIGQASALASERLDTVHNGPARVSGNGTSPKQVR